MSAVLATNMTNNMSNRAGYLTFNEIMDENLMYYTFKDCIKYNKEGFHSWICYWEGSPIAVQCTVKASVLANGFTKVAILSKELKTIDEIGMYPAKQHHCLGHVINGRFLNEKGVQSFVTKSMVDGLPVEVAQSNTVLKSSDKKVLSASEVDHFKKVMAENWGCTFK
ncbi:hypothetical protein pEaSNUABM50_00517 [Erwinia phage pEa_SNUABM_50]|uniref:Uncharacterized protein n=4 Tax=Eneladusvirus BF TaxID=2560751 RepID=A0A7L8ZNV3_9CAUD|nr:hypothetical protein FDH34_gp427 [Serratia phage BF]QOI71456.1 hypothetical protein pEaSNUABM12_00539 [Erwinia phage pEa_SNUABM_12]QOI71967.1 hypothetical protein pEaSNUABM47_00518 [Erwinia phage pEa_SNUABM_47]QOI72507.1 hypothetical protein pEaSNUABM50_00517 [Erwinia phage pEa_SNUABM_50]QXO11638.1 hypothetical protein pEaSNUABM19_00527 [Erwinia phage pEa_SNUABM_19]QXO12186.1 hypothetical protein pEaSNUABM44_00525 [Erwinia phage pEa_SNUABM_44]QXO12742.1 hypothetical protein pEaSNUABM49_005